MFIRFLKRVSSYKVGRSDKIIALILTKTKIITQETIKIKDYENRKLSIEIYEHINADIYFCIFYRMQ